MIRLVVLALLNEQASHGYELIKAIEDKTGGAYSPSPGVIYPTLSYLEDQGYVLGDAQGSKKKYSITDEGKAYLATEQPKVDAIFARFAGGSEQRGPSIDLRPTARRVWGAIMSRMGRSPEIDQKIVEILEKAADDIARL